VRVAGTVKGQINGRVVELSRTAKVTGDIVHESLAIEAGAFIQGLCRHADSGGQAPKTADSNGHDRTIKPAEVVTPQNVATAAIGDDDDKAAKSALAASAAKGQEAIKKVFR